jgi:glutathionyl-hydroquinone reductase
MLKLKGIGEDVISTSLVHWFKGVPSTPLSLLSSFSECSDHRPTDEHGVYPGWHFATPEEMAGDAPGCTPDPLYNAQYLSEIYFKAAPDYEGKFSVPVLWDKKARLSTRGVSASMLMERQTQTIVNNESDQVMRMLETAFDA